MEGTVCSASGKIKLISCKENLKIYTESKSVLNITRLNDRIVIQAHYGQIAGCIYKLY